MTEATVFRNGRIFTGVREVESVLVEQGTVVACGDDAQVQRQVPTGAERVSLGGRYATPGLVDAHMHLLECARQRDGVPLAPVGSADELVRVARTWGQEHPDGPIVGRGWDQERWAERRYPTVEDMDRISSDRPVLLSRLCNHTAIANSLALEVGGVRRQSADPPHGRIGRRPDGSLNGLLFDAAIDSVRDRLGAMRSQAPTMLESVFTEAIGHGITRIATLHASPEEVELCRRWTETAPLPLAVHVYLGERWFDEGRGWSPGSTVPDLHLDGVKTFLDGSFGARTAALGAPYDDDPRNRGLAARSDSELADLVDRVDRREIQLAIHAIGDAALGQAVKVLRGRSPRRTVRIEHASLTPPALQAGLDALRPYLVVQPSFLLTDDWLPERLGDRTRWAYAFRSLVERGHALAGSSDAPAAPLDPWGAMRAAVQRPPPFGPPNPSATTESVSVETALTMYTRNAGATLSVPGAGTLEPGAPGDLVELAGDRLDQVLMANNGPVRRVWRAGRLVHSPPR